MRTLTAGQLRANLKSAMDGVADDHEILIVNRPENKHVVLMSLEDFNAWQETAYLMESRSNAEHLLKSIDQVQKGETVKMDFDDL